MISAVYFLPLRRKTSDQTVLLRFAMTLRLLALDRMPVSLFGMAGDRTRRIPAPNAPTLAPPIFAVTADTNAVASRKGRPGPAATSTRPIDRNSCHGGTHA
jgi:hypothetical protein